MLLIQFLLNKVVLIILSSAVISSVTVYGGIKTNDYRQTQIILQEAKQLSASGKYQEAISRLITTEDKWSPKNLKEKIKLDIEENKLLVESTENYELGKELFDNKDNNEAIEILKKVDSRNINYTKARALIELAQKKIAEVSASAVAGANTENKVARAIFEPITTPSLSPTTTPVPTLQPTPLKDPGKTAELKNIMAEIKRLAVVRANASVALNFYQENYTKAQASGQESIFQSDIDAQIKTITEVDSKVRELVYRANILTAECSACWEEAQKDLH